MSDKGHGGKRKGAGRKSKKDEDKLQAYLSAYEEDVLEKMIEGCKNGDHKFIKMFMEYRYGRPKERKDITTNGKDLNLGMIKWYNSEEE